MRKPILHPLTPTKPFGSPFLHEWESLFSPGGRRSSRRHPFDFMPSTPRFYEIGSSSSPRSSAAPPPNVPTAKYDPALNEMVATKVDWKETGGAHVLKVEVPGMKKEDVKVEVEGGDVVKVSGEVKRGELESAEVWRVKERSAGKLVRKFKLDGNPKMEEIQAKMEDGVLTLTIPKEVKVVAIAD